MLANLESSTAFSPRRSFFEANSSSSIRYVQFTPAPPAPILKRRVEETNTAQLEPPQDAVDDRKRGANDKLLQQRHAMCGVIARIVELSRPALLAGEPYSPESAFDGAMFLKALGITKRPSIYLLENGNVQCVWRNDAKEQVSLQFFGYKIVQFAMFALRPDQPMARIAGRDTVAKIRAKIDEHGCRHLIE